jgi:hypothetical protein
MRDRLSYAAIGLVLGSFLAVVLWWLYGLGLSQQWGFSAPQPRLLPWLAYVGGGSALAGFILKERIGDLVGSALHAVYDAETLGERSPTIPAWLVVVVLVAVVAAVWYFVAA